MSKELRIGMAIGAVFLVLVIVYLAVPKTTSQVTQDTPTAEDTTSAAVEGETPAAPDAPQAEEPSGVPGVDSAEQGVDPFAGNGAGTPDGATEQASSDAGTNWAKLLETGDLPSTSITPSLRAAERVAPQNASENPASPVSPVTPEETAKPAVTPEAVPDATKVDEGAAKNPAGAVSEESAGNRVSPPAAPTSVAAARTHTMKSGENYSTIARAVYGDARHYLAIQEANPNLDPARLKPGTVITLPELAAAKSDAPAAEPNGPAEQASEKQVDSDAYRVQSGDSLYKIAVKRYGTSNMIDEIYELNKGAIGEDSSRLKLGMVLKMPAAPKADAPAQ